MSFATEKAPFKVVLDTNVLISSIIFGGRPKQAVKIVLEKQIIGVTSKVLLAELAEVLAKKFSFDQKRINHLEQKIKRAFILTQPKKTLKILKDEADNRVLEAALESDCDFIVTGDTELLNLGSFRGIKIINTAKFLEETKK